MFESRLLASVVAGVPVSLLCLGYVALRRDAVVRHLTEGGGAEAVSREAATMLSFATAAAIGPGLGLMAAVVRGWMPSDGAYLGLAVGIGALMTVIAVATRTPMMVEKVVLNGAVVAMLGLVAPRLAAG